MCGSFFVHKIAQIRESFPDVSPSAVIPSPQISDETTLTSFHPASEEEIRPLIRTSPSKSCELDPIPTHLLKACVDSLVTSISLLAYKCLAEGFPPSVFKKAHVIPVLKRNSLCKEDVKNYRPVSNLSYVSRVIEKVVSSRILSHLADSNKSTPFQSVYRKERSTEATVLPIHNDALTAMDKGRVTALTLLDLSAAFDTIDNTALLGK